MIKKIKFIFFNISKKIFHIIISIIPRNNSICLFNCMTNSINKTYGFTHNTKYLFLHMSNNSECGFTPVWITPDKNIVKTLKENGYNACYKNSIKGFLLCLFAKYYILNVEIANGEISKWLLGGATCINLWHGIALKHIGKDNISIYKSLPDWQKKIYELLETKNDYYIANSDYEINIFSSAFLMKKEKIKIIGSPRIDTLFNSFKGENLFMEHDIQKIYDIKKNRKKIILYVPTYRDTGANIAKWVENPQIIDLFKNSNYVLVCKLHPVDYNSIQIENSEYIHIMNNNSDINSILKYTDALITDYSSVNFDYTLLNKPILYYSPDVNDYQINCHGFYTSYQDFTVGYVAQNEKMLIEGLKELISGRDNYKEQRKALRDRMFKYQDGKNCERVVEWIKSLDKKKGK